MSSAPFPALMATRPGQGASCCGWPEVRDSSSGVTFEPAAPFMTASLVPFTQTPWSASPAVTRVMGAVSSRGVPSGARIRPVTCTLDFPFCSDMTRARTPSREIRNSFTVRPASQDGASVTDGTGAPSATPVGWKATTSVAPEAPGPDDHTQSLTLKDGRLSVLRVVRARAGWPGLMLYKV